MSFLNRVGFETATTGDGTVTVGAALPGYATPADAGASNGVTYTWAIEDGDDFEIVRGAYSSSGPEVARDTVLLSKIGGSYGTTKLNLSGTATVRCVAAAEDILARLTLPNLVDLTTPVSAGFSGGNITLDVAHGAQQFFVRQMAGAETLLAPVDMPAGLEIMVGIEPAADASSTPTVSGQDGSAHTSTNRNFHEISLPSGIQAGELLVAVVSLDGAEYGGFAGTGWRTVSAGASGSDVTGVVLAKIADGADELMLFTIGTQRAAWEVLRISNHIGLISASIATGSSTNANPPNHAPPTGSGHYLWIAAACLDGNPSVSGAPASYGNLQVRSGANSSDGCVVATAWRNATASAEDPGAFTSASEQWVAFTIAIPPNPWHPLSFGSGYEEPLPGPLRGESLYRIVHLGSGRYVANKEWEA